MFNDNFGLGLLIVKVLSWVIGVEFYVLLSG